MIVCLTIMSNNNTNETKEQQPRTGNFDDTADEYDAKAESIWKFHHGLVKIFQPALTADQTLLEFGCGKGIICLSLCPRLRHVYGIDISANMLAKAREKILQRNLTERATVRELHLTLDVKGANVGDWLSRTLRLDSVRHVVTPCPQSHGKIRITDWLASRRTQGQARHCRIYHDGRTRSSSSSSSWARKQAPKRQTEGTKEAL